MWKWLQILRLETMRKLMDSFVCLETEWTDLLSNERSLRNSTAKLIEITVDNLHFCYTFLIWNDDHFAYVINFQYCFAFDWQNFQVQIMFVVIFLYILDNYIAWSFLVLKLYHYFFRNLIWILILKFYQFFIHFLSL